MPIRRHQRHFYPIDWPLLSAAIRFGRAGSRCERCARPHGAHVWHLGETPVNGRAGLWWDETASIWRCGAGRRVPLAPLETVRDELDRQGNLWPDMPCGVPVLRCSEVRLACCHLDHDPSNNTGSNLAALCQRCHLKHDAADNLARRRANSWARTTAGMLPLPLPV